jgi:phage tail sheath protein FI
MGMMARSDSNSLKGPFETPAGTTRGVLYGATDVETSTVNRRSVRDVIYPVRINPITTSPKGNGVYVDGSKTGLGTGNFPSVGERRGASHLASVFYAGLQYARHENNTAALRSSLEKTVKGELLTWCEAGAFASGDPSAAFMVDADIPGTGLNNARIRAQNKVYVRYGIATAKPADYVILLTSQDTRAYEESLA